LDKALKRNLDAQKAKIEKKIEVQNNDIATDSLEDRTIEAEPIE